MHQSSFISYCLACEGNLLICHLQFGIAFLRKMLFLSEVFRILFIRFIPQPSLCINYYSKMTTLTNDSNPTNINTNKNTTKSQPKRRLFSTQMQFAFHLYQLMLLCLKSTFHNFQKVTHIIFYCLINLLFICSYCQLLTFTIASINHLVTPRHQFSNKQIQS